ncbi:transcription factor ilr3 [Phtheirospermum japonicum]|uniref:Transcription factor ilr3 n=1 Tax=Phtheirospermum japonicum TaxID=374723 RepID=A0A830BDC0_9LAMI|nr:transcription factor ilr3 [Phtheirospermum japonicum]
MIPLAGPAPGYLGSSYNRLGLQAVTGPGWTMTRSSYDGLDCFGRPSFEVLIEGFRGISAGRRIRLVCVEIDGSLGESDVPKETGTKKRSRTEGMCLHQAQKHAGRSYEGIS